MSYDVAVVGLGGMGSAIVAECAARGASVVGIDQHVPPHSFGSSHGRSRMIRKAYFENAAYVPLLIRAYELWRRLEREADEEILRITGVLTVGEESSEIICGTREASALHDLPLQSLGRAEVAARYPAIRLLKDEVAVFENDGGVLDPEAAVSAQLKLAREDHAELLLGTALRDYEPTARGFDLQFEDGSAITARKLILALGPWFKDALAKLGVEIRVQRNVQAWFSPETLSFDAGNFPGFFLNRRGLPAPLYGFPDFGHGVKVAFHGFGESTDAETLDRNIDDARDIEPLVFAMDDWMPRAAATFREASACMYTCTPDEHFIVDRHPEHANLVLCGGFSGHGFKFAPIIGEIAADLALDGASRHEIEFLSLARFNS